jgi:hypothetical protein
MIEGQGAAGSPRISIFTRLHLFDARFMYLETEFLIMVECERS